MSEERWEEAVARRVVVESFMDHNPTVAVDGLPLGALEALAGEWNSECVRRNEEAVRLHKAARAKVRDGRWSDITADEQRWILSALGADYCDE